MPEQTESRTSHDNAGCGVTLYRVSPNVALVSRARLKFQPTYIDQIESDTLSQNIKGVAVWRRDPGRETEGYYIFSNRLNGYRPIHYIQEDRLWVYVAVDEANKWYTIKPVPLGLGVGPTLRPITPIDVDQPEDSPAEGSQNPTISSLTTVPPQPATVTPQITMSTTTDDKGKQRSEGRCFRCNQQGHISRYCPQRSDKPSAITTSVALTSSQPISNQQKAQAYLATLHSEPEEVRNAFAEELFAKKEDFLNA